MNKIIFYVYKRFDWINIMFLYDKKYHLIMKHKENIELSRQFELFPLEKQKKILTDASEYIHNYSIKLCNTKCKSIDLINHKTGKITKSYSLYIEDNKIILDIPPEMPYYCDKCMDDFSENPESHIMKYHMEK